MNHECPITLRDIVEESAPIRVVIGNLPYVISFNISISLDHLVVLGLNILILKLVGENDFQQKPESNFIVVTNRDTKPHQISTISLQRF